MEEFVMLNKEEEYANNNNSASNLSASPIPLALESLLKEDKGYNYYYKMESIHLNKWNSMICKIDKYTNRRSKKFKKLKIRTRAGVPECMRGYIWQEFADVNFF